MFSLFRLTHLLLIFAVTLSSSWQHESFGGEFGKQQPADDPKNENEEKEKEEAKESKLADGDDLHSYGMVLSGVEIDFHGWVLHQLETTFCRGIFHDSYGHCRAPPAISC